MHESYLYDMTIFTQVRPLGSIIPYVLLGFLIGYDEQGLQVLVSVVGACRG